MNVPNSATVLGMKVTQDQIFDLRQSGYSFFFQDNYSLKNSLTINAGLRYEFMTNPSETRGHLNSIRDFFGTQVIYGDLYKNPTKKNLSPRLGFVWSPGDHKFSVRGGARSTTSRHPCSARSSICKAFCLTV